MNRDETESEASKSQQLSVIIPAYNEERRIKASIESILNYLECKDYSWEIIVSDDGSTDGTSEFIEKAQKNCKSLYLHHSPRQTGKGGALKRAMITDQTFDGKQANVNQATKMLRTFIAQMEALKKYRTGGEQKVTVEHVHVNEGGRAIVGAVNQGGGGSDSKKRR